MADAGWFEADIEELRAAGSAMLGTGDAVQVVAGASVVLGHGAYVHAGLEGAAGRFADRFTYLVDGLGREAVHAGQALRRSADEY